MKKFIVLASSALLLLAGCAKEIRSLNGSEGGLQSVSFTAQIAGDATKASADGDGAAANVNRCIMEVYYDNSLFTRMYAPVSSKQASFTTQLVSNRTYTVVFWADCVDAAGTSITEAELLSDKYYTTNAEGGLQAVALKGTYAGNDDARDAFFYSGSYTVAQGGSNFDVTLKRPFAQINIITTDWDKVSTVSSLKPETVDVTVKNPYTVFNAVTGKASTTVASINYNAAVYAPAASGNEKTLSMDYLFVTEDKQVIDIDFKAQKAGNTDVAHSFTNIPCQRNYRTNIKGALLTTTGKWNVTVDPIWSGEHAQIVEVADIKTANEQIAANTDKKILDVKFSAKPNDSGKPTGSASSASRAILTTPLSSGSVLSVEVMTNTESLYVGDYQYEYDVDNGTVAANAAVVNINVPNGASIGTLVINAPSKTVRINGKQVANVGTITNLDAITSDNTLVIEANQTVGTLTLRQGAVKIYGTVNAAVVEVASGKNVYVRDCEGLSQAVYTVLEPYIDIDNGYAGVQVGEKWDIKAGAATPVAKIGEKVYYVLKTAISEAVSGDEIVILNDCTQGEQIVINKNLGFDLNSKKISFNISGERALSLSNQAELSFKDGSLALINSASLGLIDMTGGKSLTMTDVDMTGNTSDINSKKSGFIFNGDNATGKSFTLTSCTGETNYRIFRNQSADCTLSVTGGTYTCGGYNVAFQDAGSATYKNVEITVNGSGASQYQSGIYVNGGEATIENCTVYCPNSVKGSVTVCFNGTATIDGGTYSGNYAVQVLNSGGIVKIKQGTTVNAVKSDDYALYTDSRNKGETDDNTAEIYVEGGSINGNIGVQHKGKVYVSGGAVSGVVSLTGEGNPIVVDGGTFSFNPSDFTVQGTQYTTCVKEGYVAIAQGTTPETWNVVVDPFAGKVAKIGDVGYASFAEAVNAVKANETITLLDNASVPGNYTSESPLSLTKSGVTVDLNNKTLTVVNNVAFVIKGANDIVRNGIVKSGERSHATYTYQSYALKLVDASGALFDGLTVTGGINSSNSTCQLQNCTVKAGEWAAVCAQNSSVITIKSGSYKGFPTGAANCRSLYLLTGGKIYVEGGDFVGNLILDSDTNNKFEFSGGTVESIQSETFMTSYLKSGYSANTTSEKINGVWHYYTTVTKN